MAVENTPNRPPTSTLILLYSTLLLFAPCCTGEEQTPFTADEQCCCVVMCCAACWEGQTWSCLLVAVMVNQTPNTPSSSTGIAIARGRKGKSGFGMLTVSPLYLPEVLQATRVRFANNERPSIPSSASDWEWFSIGLSFCGICE
jgi:hypothetical protein